MPKLTRILLVIFKVNECGTNVLQQMLLQENMHQVAGMNTLVLKAIWQLLGRNSKTSYFQIRVCYVGKTRDWRMYALSEVCDKIHVGAGNITGHKLINSSGTRSTNENASCYNDPQMLHSLNEGLCHSFPMLHKTQGTNNLIYIHISYISRIHYGN